LTDGLGFEELAFFARVMKTEGFVIAGTKYAAAATVRIGELTNEQKSCTWMA
jgi:hypothetical protein